MHHHSVARLVIGGQLTLVLGDHPAFLLRSGDDLDLRVLQILHGDELLIFPGGQQGSLVDEVLQVRAGETRSAPGQLAQVHILRQGLALGVDLQDLLPAPDVGQAHVHLPVEPTGPQQRRVQHIRPVGGRQDHHTFVSGKAVHLHQQLIQGLLPLVMAAAQARAPLAAHSVDLVNKHDSRGVLLGLLEQVPDAAGAHAHVQLHEIGAGDGQEAHAGLPCHGLGQQGLAGAGRAHQQHALGNPGPQRQVLLGVLQELHDLPELLLLLIGAGHVVESDLFVLVRQHPGPGGAEFGHLVRSHATSLGPNHQEVPHQPQDHRRQQEGQQLQQPVGAHRLRVIIVLDDTLRILLLNQVIEVVIKQLEAVQLIPHGLAAVHRLPQLQGQCAAAVNGQPRHFFLQEQLADLGVFQLVHMVVVLPEPVDTQQDHEGQQYEAQIG